jgi:hypothetical protein
MSFDLEALDELGQAERDRLEAFAAIFDRLDARNYSTFTETVEPGDVNGAKERALALIGSGPGGTPSAQRSQPSSTRRRSRTRAACRSRIRSCCSNRCRIAQRFGFVSWARWSERSSP